MRLAASAEEKLRPSDPQEDDKKAETYKKKRGKRRKLLADIKLLIYISYPIADKTRSEDNQPKDARREDEISKPTGLNKLQINKGGFPLKQNRHMLPKLLTIPVRHKRFG
jgi:hypothetical protein